MGLSTATWTRVPAVPPGGCTVSCVGLATTTPVPTPVRNRTTVVPVVWKPVPVIVIVLPPPLGPALGETPTNVGSVPAAAYV